MIGRNAMASPGNREPRFTLDTNILVYSFDRADARRHSLAVEIVDGAVDADCHLTLQSLSEFYWVTTRKQMLSPRQAATQIEDWMTLFRCIAASETAVRTALADTVAGRASYWDALIVATAAESGCTVIVTEDLAHGGTLGGVEILNPFAADGGLVEPMRVLLKL